METPPQKTMVIIDGLDEWGSETERGTLLDGLFCLCNQMSGLIMVITSRPYPDIKTSMSASQTVKMFNLTYDYDTSEDIAMVVRSRLKAEQLTSKEVEKLVAKADGLFIWITTALDYIGKAVNMRGKLEIILADTTTNNNDKPYNQLYSLYNTVLQEAFSDDEDCKYFKEAIGVLLTACEPISQATLSQMCYGESSSKILSKILESLTAVVYRQGEKLYSHLSFREFLFSDQAQRWAISEKECHLQLYSGCIEIMTKELKFNICHLETSCLENSDVINPSIERRVAKYITDHLQYSCQWWTQHLRVIMDHPRIKHIAEYTNNFVMKKQIIYWLECLSLMKKLHLVNNAFGEIKRLANIQNVCFYSNII